MNALILATLHLIVLHSLDGNKVDINPEQITSLRSQTEDENKRVLTDTVHCVIGLTDGKFVSVTESCDDVKKMLEDAK